MHIFEDIDKASCVPVSMVSSKQKWRKVRIGIAGRELKGQTRATERERERERVDVTI